MILPAPLSALCALSEAGGEKKIHRRGAKIAKGKMALLPQAGAFILSALSAESIKPAPLSALCVSSEAGGEEKIHRRGAKL